MTQTIIAFAALLTGIANLGMLMIHCRRDHERFRELEPRESQR